MECECDKIGAKIISMLSWRFRARDKQTEVKKKFFKVTKWRSFAKGCTWEFMCFFILGTIVYNLTGRWEDVGTVVVVYHLFKVVLYFFHERAWQKSKWGLIE